MPCIFVEPCHRKVHARGMCCMHYRLYQRGHLTASGEPTDKYITRTPCKVETCRTRTQLAEGFCYPHLKWFRRGAVNGDGVLLKKPKSVQCCVQGCTAGPVRNRLCREHYDQDALGGVKLAKKHCKVCPDTGYLSLGFCSTHRYQYATGMIDLDGNELRDRLSHIPYAKDAQCRVRGCTLRPDSRSFCSRHAKQFRKGQIDERGVALVALPWRNEGLTCRAPQCTNSAATLGYCQNHYKRHNRGVPLVAKFVHDFPCIVTGCKEPGYVRKMCHKHYDRTRYIMGLRGKRKKVLPPVEGRGT